MGCNLLLRQLLSLLWKNFLLQLRRPIGTAFEIILPALALLVIVGLRQIPGLTDSDIFKTCPASFRSIDLEPHSFYDDVFYTPNNPITRAIMERVEDMFQESTGRISPVEDQQTFSDMIFENNASYFIGVYFDRLEENGSDIAYTLRFPYEQEWSTNEIAFDLSSTFIRTESPYMTAGFTLLQRTLDESIIRYYANKTGKSVPNIDLDMRQFPFPPTATDFFLVILSFGLSILVILSFLYTAATITKELVIEKEARIRESMLMMGLRLWILWTSWFCKQLIFMFIWVIAYTILFKYARVWPKSDGFLIFIFFLLFIISIIAHGFLVSVWFNSPTVALIVSFLAFFVSYIPTLFILPFADRIPYGGKLVLALLSNTAFGLGVIVISDLEGQQLGLQWDNIDRPLSIEEPLNMGAIFGMMICDIILYMLIAWYVDAVKPGRYGVPKPFYFPFLPSYWTGKTRNRSSEDVENSGWHDPQAHEQEPTDMEAGISIKTLSKTYEPSVFALTRGVKLAVDGLSLNMYEGQITALLGHNGAGKTTTISILTGLYTPTAGTAIINGYDIRSNMDQIRHSLGICPQHNILFDRLTVREHLKLFAILKGMPLKDVKNEIDKMLKDLQFEGQGRTNARNLSGGMKRKLSVSIALIGGSKIVVLDEPTSGLDPYARRATWDLLAKHKEGRTILLTTHFMDEADLLGDRIAIMAEGRLMCSGSSLFLKSKYGVGYHLTLVKEPSCNTRQLSELIISTVPGSNLASDVSAELTFLLPFTSSQHFPNLLDTLEQQRESLGFSSFGVSLTTLEEVFLKFGTGSAELFTGSGYQSLPTIDDEEVKKSQVTESEASVSGGNDIELQEIHSSSLEEIVDKPPSSPTNYSRNTGIVLWFQQFCAMFMKRLYNSFRFSTAIITQITIPLISIILALLLIKLPDDAVRDDPKRLLTIRGSSMSDEAEVFLAQFGDLPSQFSFKNVTSSDIYATSLRDITDDIQSIINSTREENYSDPEDCCNYQFQLLDKFCASIDRGVLEDLNCGKDFAYRDCPVCLLCAVAKYVSTPLSYQSYSRVDSFDPDGGGICVAPPQLALDEYNNDQQPSGPVDSNNHFVAEYLLRRADDLVRSVFFRRVQAGFVFSNNEPLDGCCVSRNDYGSGSMCSLEPGFTDDEVNPTSQLYINTSLTATVWYSNQPLHTVAAALNAFDNVLLRNIMESKDWSITVYNHPLPRTQDTQEQELDGSSFAGLSVSILATFGLTFFLSSFVVFPVIEKETKAKHLQFVSGVNPISYWLGHYSWDLINALIVVILSFCIFAAYQVEGYEGEYIGALFFLLIFSCFASIPIAYLFSFIFQSHLWAYGIFYMLFFFPPLILQLTVLLLPTSTEKNIRNRDIVHYVSLLHPAYGMQSGIINIYRAGVLEDFCTMNNNDRTPTCDGYIDDIYQFLYPGIGANLMYMALEGIVLMFIIILIEYSFFVPVIMGVILYSRERSIDHSPGELLASGIDDDDVRNETMKVKSEVSNTESNAVVIKNLAKVYLPQLSGCSVAPSKRAVNKICLAIPRGEFFGFVGVNGAGKTSTFSMLTGDISPTSGTAIISGYDIRTDLRKVQQQIGYCPQFDALIERMTGRELLTMFARLRGIPERHIPDVVTSTINKLDLSKYAKKQCGKYSGGNKRKLSTAIALIGDPPILFLDEPTTGMDPGTRRYLWDVLTGVTREGRTIILTSHSMEECEALCTRLTIMVNGQFKCLGSTQHLKSKFSDGYTLQAKVRYNVTAADNTTQQQSVTTDPVSPTSTTSPTQPNTPPPVMPPSQDGTSLVYNLKVFIEQSFPNSLLAEEHQGSVTYQLPSGGLTWSSVFRQLEANKERLGIIDYSVSQTTLDQVFINFAKQQETSQL